MEDACEKCLSPLSPRARVCLRCGTTRLPTGQVEPAEGAVAAEEPLNKTERTSAVEPLAPPSPDVDAIERSQPEAAASFVAGPPQASSAPQEVQRSGVPVSVVVILILVTAMFATIFAFAWSSIPESEDDLQVVSVYVSGSANARDQPSAQGSSVLETYDAGTYLTGAWVNGASDPDERWLKFEVEGQARYIWDGNLSVDATASIAPPPAIDQANRATTDGMMGIVAGQGWGEVSSQFKSSGIYGEGVTEGCEIYESLNNRVFAMVENGKVTRLETQDRDFLTPSGVGVGSSLAELRKAYGARLIVTENIYSGRDYFIEAANGNGMKFHVEDGNVTDLTVGGSSIRYVEGCL